MNEDQLIALFKIGTKEHMTELLQEGHVFMNTMSYFATLEENSQRSDPDEGTGFCQNADGGTLQVKKQGEWRKLGTIKGGIRVRKEALLTSNLYCLHARTQCDDNTDFMLNQLGFGDSYVLFLDANEFFRRLEAAASTVGQKLVYGLVEYVDRHSYTGPMGVFRKFSEWTSNSEYRVAALPGTGYPFSLRLGNISDIAIMGMTCERLRLDNAQPALDM